MTGATRPRVSGAALVVMLVALASLALLYSAMRPSATAGQAAAGAGAVARSQGEPCGKVAVSEFAVDGGCRLEVRSGRMSFTVVSMFGDERFARCPVRFDLRVDAAGRLAFRKVTIVEGYGTLPNCGDMLACRSAAEFRKDTEHTLPWTGRVVARDGGLRLRIDTCFDTCFGRFEGPSEFELERSGQRRWRMRSARSAVGVSGFELSGSLLLAPAAS
jgi:hypothetical protein